MFPRASAGTSSRSAAARHRRAGLETWDASPWGTSGNANTNWTIGLGGNSGGALSNEPIGGGLGGSGANVATAGVDVGNWLGNWARQYFQPAADRGIDVWDATPDITTWDATVNSPAETTVWSGDVLNWVPAGGTWGTPGAVSPSAGWAEQNAGGGQGMYYNPATTNWGSWTNPSSGATVVPYDTNYADYFNTLGISGATPFGSVNQETGLFNSAYSGYGVGGVNSLGYYVTDPSGGHGHFVSQSPGIDLGTGGYSSGQQIITSGSPTFGGIDTAAGVNTAGQVVGGLIGPGGIPLAAGIYN